MASTTSSWRKSCRAKNGDCQRSAGFASATALSPIWGRRRKSVTVPFFATTDFHHGLLGFHKHWHRSPVFKFRKI